MESRLLRNELDVELTNAISSFTFEKEGPIQSVIHSFKYRAMPRLAETLGSLCADALPEILDMIVPVPLHRTRLGERGYNQAEKLACGLADKRKLSVIKAIKRIRPTPTQTSLSVPERLENVRGAFAPTRRAGLLEGKHVLLVDDVITTGATVLSAAEALVTANPASISVYSLAVAPRDLSIK